MVSTFCQLTSEDPKAFIFFSGLNLQLLTSKLRAQPQAVQVHNARSYVSANVTCGIYYYDNNRIGPRET